LRLHRCEKPRDADAVSPCQSSRPGLRIAPAPSRQKGGSGERSSDRAAQCATLIAPCGMTDRSTRIPRLL